MARTAEQARQWAAAIAGGGLAVVLLALAVRIPVRSGPWPAGEGASLGGPPLEVRWGADRPQAALSEAAQLMDPNPLFMPTAKSVTSARHGSTGLGDRFQALTMPGAFKFQPGDLRLEKLPPPVPMPATPADALAANPPGNLTMGMGRTDQATLAFAARQAWVNVTAPGTGKILLRIALPLQSVPRLVADDWDPAYFSANVNAGGLVGSIVPMPSSPTPGGFATLDSDTAQQLANYLESKLLLGLKLEPGFYQICVGP